MEGMEQLDTVISFRDGGTGIARELQRAVSRSQSSLQGGTSSPLSETSEAGATSFLCRRRSATL